MFLQINHNNYNNHNNLVLKTFLIKKPLMSYYNFQYGPMYGAPAQSNKRSVNVVTAASPGSFGSIPSQLALASGDSPQPRRRTVTLTTGSLAGAHVFVYDINGKLLGGVTTAGQPSPLVGRQDIGRVTISDGTNNMLPLDLRQASEWLNQIMDVGVTVGRDASGQLIGSIVNLDAVHNIYPDRDGVTFGTKCVYMLGSAGADGQLHCV
jgi:hypothetical protein